MKNLILIVLILSSLTSCAQSGGLGFWNTIEHSGGDTITGMYYGPFLVRQEGAEHYAYMIPRDKHVVVRHRVSPSIQRGVIIYGEWEEDGVLNNPLEIKEVGGYLFVLDQPKMSSSGSVLGGTRITRINLSNWSDVTVLFNNFSTPYPLASFTPLLQPGDPISNAELYGMYWNLDGSYFSYEGDTLSRRTISGDVNAISLISEVRSSTQVVLRSGTPGYYNTNPPNIVGSYQNAAISAGLWEGVNRLVVSTTYFRLGGESSAIILASDTLRYGFRNGTFDKRRVEIAKNFMAPGYAKEIYVAPQPSLWVGNQYAVMGSTNFHGSGMFTALYWKDGTTTNGPMFRCAYWSPVLNSTSTSVYVISSSAAGANNYFMHQLSKNGSSRFVSGISN